MIYSPNDAGGLLCAAPAPVAEPPVSAFPNGRGRDLRIDFFRGLALWWIFVDHIRNNIVRKVTLEEFTFCDCAEVFVLLAGISAGLSYSRRLQRSGIGDCVRHASRRAATLYGMHLVLFALVAAELFGLKHFFSVDAVADRNYWTAMADWPRAIPAILTLQLQGPFSDILPLYVCLMIGMVIGVLPLLQRPRLLLWLSATLYLLTRSLRFQMPSWHGHWTFSPMAWQFLFVIGIVVAPHTKRLPTGALWTWLAGALLLASAALYHGHHLWPNVKSALGLLDVDKVNLHPARLLSILALAWVVWRVLPVQFRGLKSRVAGQFIRMGQHPLPVFCVGVLLAIAGTTIGTGYLSLRSQLAINGVGLAILLLTAKLSSMVSPRETAAVRR